MMHLNAQATWSECDRMHHTSRCVTYNKQSHFCNSNWTSHYKSSKSFLPSLPMHPTRLRWPPIIRMSDSICPMQTYAFYNLILVTSQTCLNNSVRFCKGRSANSRRIFPDNSESCKCVVWAESPLQWVYRWQAMQKLDPFGIDILIVVSPLSSAMPSPLTRHFNVCTDEPFNSSWIEILTELGDVFGKILSTASGEWKCLCLGTPSSDCHWENQNPPPVQKLQILFSQWSVCKYEGLWEKDVSGDV